MNIILLAASLVAGFCFGSYISKKENIIGSIVIDNSDPDFPCMFLEIDKNRTKDLMTEKSVTVRVEHRNYISQK